MLKTKVVTVEKIINVCTCDRCGRVMEQDADDWEYQEKFSIATRVGYASVFGDGNLVEGDFCQICIQKTLGKWLKVTEDAPPGFNKKLSSMFDKIMQPYQRHLENERKLKNQTKDI
ncbi:MAG: hypothetical protein WCI39_12740 [Gallionellaceae bacterium]